MSDVSNFPDIKYRHIIPPFRAWVQKSLPAVYDDSLSYSELLSRVIKYLNDVIINTDGIINEFNELHDYVYNFFKNLDVQEEIDNKLDQMVEDGTFQQIISEFVSKWACVNVKACGAKGDGVTDDTKAIQSCLDNGGCVMIPPGTYKVSSLTINSPCTFKGIDKQSCILLVSGSVSLTSTMPEDSNQPSVALRDMYIQSDDSTDNGLNLNGRGIVLDNVTVDGFQYGIYMNTGCLDNTINNVTCLNCAEDGFYIQGYGAKITNCTAKLCNYGAGFHTITGGNFLSGVKAFDNVYGLLMDRESDFITVKGEFQENYVNNVRLDSVSCYGNFLDIECIGADAWPENGYGNRVRTCDLYVGQAQNNFIKMSSHIFNKNWKSTPDYMVYIGYATFDNIIDISFTDNSATNMTDLQVFGDGGGSVGPFSYIGVNASPQNTIIMNGKKIEYETIETPTFINEDPNNLFNNVKNGEIITLSLKDAINFPITELDDLVNSNYYHFLSNIEEADEPDYIAFEFDISMMNYNSAYAAIVTGELEFILNSKEVNGFLPQGVEAERFFRTNYWPFTSKKHIKIAGDLSRIRTLEGFGGFKTAGFRISFLKFENSTEDNVGVNIENITVQMGKYKTYL